VPLRAFFSLRIVPLPRTNLSAISRGNQELPPLFSRRPLSFAPLVVILFVAAPIFAREKKPELGASQERNQITLGSELVTVVYDRRTGKMDVLWHDGHRLLGVISGARLADDRSLLTSQYPEHDLDPDDPGIGLPAGEHVYTIRSVGRGMPTILQHVWLCDGKPWISIQAELDPQASAVGTRHFDAVLIQQPNAVDIGKNAALRVLHVPFDNDMWFRYDSVPVATMKSGETYASDEVTAVYDNSSRQALILGSITHDVWKTAIDVSAADDQLSSIDVYGGISSPNGVRTDTHDTVPHGLVHGSHVLSPRIFIGSFADWRDGLEAYGQANAQMQAPLVWPAGAPMGWNSWAAYADKIDYQRYLGSAAYVRDTLVPQGFGRNQLVYINLDAFWSRLDAPQLADAVAIIKGMRGAGGVHFEPGIYWTPFAYWSDDLDAYVEGTNMKFRYRDVLLRAADGSLLPKVDGGRPIDPSSPGEKERIAYFISEFKKLGFTYLKLDFLSHGALEGAHSDPAIQTGIEAYNEGMREIVRENGGRMFLSLSIAPLFPSGYGNARRLSCDTKGHISGENQSTEYMLNSLTYGFWTAGNLYVADPDHVVLGEKADQGARSIAEGRSRLLSAIVSGGMILDSSRLADDPEGRALAKAVYDNPNLFAVAAEGKVFRPVEGDTGDRAAAAFVRSSPHGYYLAVFNFDDQESHAIRVPLERIASALGTASTVSVTDVASGSALPPARGTVTIQLGPAASELVELRSGL
jgi:alpha-galactosidase